MGKVFHLILSLFTVCHINENLNLNNSLSNSQGEDPDLIELFVQSRSSRHREVIKLHPVSILT